MLSQIVSEFTYLGGKRAFWQTDLAPGVELICDPDKLERVLDNLIRNAINYSYENSAISLAMSAQAESVQIVVKNHGRTIPPDKLGRIFEQFFDWIRLDPLPQAARG